MTGVERWTRRIPTGEKVQKEVGEMKRGILFTVLLAGLLVFCFCGNPLCAGQSGWVECETGADGTLEAVAAVSGSTA